MSALLSWLYARIAPFIAKRFIAEAEVDTAIHCADSLRRLYSRADELDSAGFTQLAQELRTYADQVDIAAPGGRTLDYLDQLNKRHPALTDNGRAERLPLPGASTNGAASAEEPVKRRRGRPRKSV